MGVIGVVIVVLLIYSKKLQTPKDDSEETNQKEKSKQAKNKTQKGTEGRAEDLLGFRSIDQGVITLEDGKSLRAVIGVDALNYHSLSESEQEAVDGSMAGVLSSITYSIQPISITSPVDLQDFTAQMKKDISSLTGVLQQYAEEHIRYLDEETKQEILIKQDFLVVGTDWMEDRGQAINELDRRCGLIISGLRRAGHIAQVLDTQEVSNIFYDIFHANRVVNARLKDALGDQSVSFAVERDKAVHPTFEESEEQNQRLVML